MSTRRPRSAIPALGCALALFTTLRAADRPIGVVALSTVLADIAREVGGVRVSVTDLVRPGVDPHDFDPAPADMRSIAGADLVLASGLHLESYLDRLVAGSGAQNRVVAVGDSVPLVLSLEPHSGEDAEGVVRERASADGELDPHWWHSIGNALAATDLIRSEFARLRPAEAGVFSANAAAYRGRLLALQSWAGRTIARIPPSRRQLVTSHDAFGYFAHDYGFTLRPISGLSTESEPNARHLARLIGVIRREHIPAVFAEKDVNPELVANLVAETGVRLGRELYGDGLGPEGSDAATYEAMYRHNVQAIVDGLR